MHFYLEVLEGFLSLFFPKYITWTHPSVFQPYWLSCNFQVTPYYFIERQAPVPSKVSLNPLPFLHRVGLSPCILPAQRTDSTPSCVWFLSSQTESRALTWTSRVQLDSSQKDTGKELLSATNGRTPLCPTSSFFFFLPCKKKPWWEWAQFQLSLQLLPPAGCQLGVQR